MSLIKVNPKADWYSDKLQIGIIRDWQGLNLGNNWWKTHYSKKFDYAESICPNLHFLDLETDPSINNVYSNDSAIDGSRFQYNSLQKTAVKLNFWLQFENYRDFIDKKHDIESYFSAKAGFEINTNYHPNLHFRGYVNKIEMKPNGPNDCVFTITMDNAFGMWFSNNTQYLEEHWDNQAAKDLRVPRNFLSNSKPSWHLHAGTNKVWVGGDCIIQLSNPIVQSRIFLYGCTDNVTVYNKTTNTKLIATNNQNAPAISGNFVWMNLNFGKVNSINPKSRSINYTPYNQCTNSSDFWLDPGWNEIELSNCSSGYIDTRFYFSNF